MAAFLLANLIHTRKVWKSLYRTFAFLAFALLAFELTIWHYLWVTMPEHVTYFLPWLTNWDVLYGAAGSTALIVAAEGVRAIKTKAIFGRKKSDELGEQSKVRQL